MLANQHHQGAGGATQHSPPHPQQELEPFPSNIKDYTFIKELGKGAFGKVWEGDCGGRRVAIKSLIKSIIESHGGPRMIERVRNEIGLHYHLNHPNVIELLFFFEDEDFVYMVLELGRFELYKALRLWRSNRLDGFNGLMDFGSNQNNNHLSFFNDPTMFKRIFKDIVEGLSYLHSISVMHRDLKLSNILLVPSEDGRTMTAKIADFGLAVKAKEVRDEDVLLEQDEAVTAAAASATAAAEEEEQTMCGTPNYLAPEIVRKLPYGPSADIWSLGCLLYTMLVGRPPFESANGDIRETFHRLQRAQFSFPSGFKDAVGKDLIVSMLRCSPLLRPTINDIKRHPFLLGVGCIRSFGVGVGGFLNDYNATYNNVQSNDHNTNHHGINLRNLKPIRQETRYCIFDLKRNPFGTKMVLMVESKQNQPHTRRNRRLVIKEAGVGGNGEVYTEDVYTGERVDHLSKSDHLLLDYSKRFISLLRSKTPHVVFKCEEFTSFLMENLPKPDYLLKLKNGSRMHLKTLENVIVIIDVNNGSNVRVDLSQRNYDQHLSSSCREIMQIGIGNYREIGAFLKYYNSNSKGRLNLIFPLRLGRGIGGCVVELPDTHASAEMTSDYLTQYRRVGNDDFDFDSTVKAYIEGVGWCMAGPKGKFMLLFSDGYTLLVDGPSNRVAFTQVGSSFSVFSSVNSSAGGNDGRSFTNTANTTKTTTFLQINSSLPVIYKEKLAYLPKFIEKLREGLGHSFC